MRQFKEYPSLVKTRSVKGDQEWIKLNDLYAQTDLISEVPAKNEVARISQKIAICQPAGDLEMSRETEQSQKPVYRLGDHGPVGVPTGLIFIRFDEEVPLDGRRQRLKELGFELAKEPTQAAGVWVRHQSGTCEESLSKAAHLRDIDGLRVVEPQFLIPRQSKSSRGPMQRP